LIKILSNEWAAIPNQKTTEFMLYKHTQSHKTEVK